jgi:hypothetical protein
MAKKSKKKQKGGFLLGALFGAGLGATGVFLSKKENRQKVAKTTEKAKKELEKTAKVAQAEVKKVTKTAKKEIDKATKTAKKTAATSKNATKKLVKKALKK